MRSFKCRISTAVINVLTCDVLADRAGGACAGSATSSTKYISTSTSDQQRLVESLDIHSSRPCYPDNKIHSPENKGTIEKVDYLNALAET